MQFIILQIIILIRLCVKHRLTNCLQLPPSLNYGGQAIVPPACHGVVQRRRERNLFFSTETYNFAAARAARSLRSLLLKVICPKIASFFRRSTV